MILFLLYLAPILIPVNIYQMHADKPGLTNPQAAFSWCERRWNKTFKGAKIVLNSYHDERLKVCHPDMRVSDFTCYWFKLVEQYPSKRNQVNFFSLPNLYDGQTKLFAGLACFSCFNNIYSNVLVFASDTSRSGKNRVDAAGAILCHELGHLFGAEHDNSPGYYMSSDFGPFLHRLGDLRWSKRSRKAIKRYVRSLK